ncbi:hypothetical protein NUSPORA_02988 [Nucleospora cyclopteri]
MTEGVKEINKSNISCKIIDRKLTMTEGIKEINLNKSNISCVIIDPLPFTERYSLMNYRIISLIDITKPFVIYTADIKNTIVDLNILINKERFMGMEIFNSNNVLNFYNRKNIDEECVIFIKGTNDDRYFGIIQKYKQSIILMDVENVIDIII